MLRVVVLLFYCVELAIAYSCFKDYNYLQSGASFSSEAWHEQYGCTTRTYKIRPSIQMKYIRLKWNSFSVKGDMPNCYSDKVEVYTGCENRVKVAKLCSNNLKGKPHDIYSKDGCIDLEFTRSNSASSFTVSYQSFYEFSTNLDIPSYCSTTTTKSSDSGIIASPKWPSSYRSHYCKWKVRTSKDYVTQYNVMDMDLPSSYYCYSYTADSVELSGERSSPYSYFSERFCNDIPYYRQRSFNTKNYWTTVLFKSSRYSTTARGFVVGWLTYKNSNSIEHNLDSQTYKHSPNLLPVVISIIVVISVIIIVVIRVRKKRALMAATQRHFEEANRTRSENTVTQSQSQASRAQFGIHGNQTDLGKINQGMNAPPYSRHPSMQPYYLPPPAYPGPPVEQPPAYQPPSYESVACGNSSQVPPQLSHHPPLEQYPPQLLPQAATHVTVVSQQTPATSTSAPQQPLTTLSAPSQSPSEPPPPSV